MNNVKKVWYILLLAILIAGILLPAVAEVFPGATTADGKIYVKYYSPKYGTATLGYGDTGTYVTNLQKDIKAVDSSWIAKVDGKYGDNTQKGVKKFQQWADISIDGIAGHQTKCNLFQVTYGWGR